jgi:hypothetical protein
LDEMTLTNQSMLSVSPSPVSALYAIWEIRNDSWSG